MTISSIGAGSASLAVLKTNRLANVKLNVLGTNIRPQQLQATQSTQALVLQPASAGGVESTPKTKVVDNTPIVSFPGANLPNTRPLSNNGGSIPGIKPDEQLTIEQRIGKMFEGGKNLIEKMINVAKQASDSSLSPTDRASLNEQFMKLRSAYENMAGGLNREGLTQAQSSSLNGLFALTKIGISGLVPGQGDLTSARNAQATASILQKRIGQISQVWDNAGEKMFGVNYVPLGTGGIKPTKPIDNTPVVSFPGLVANNTGPETKKIDSGINFVV